MYRINFYKFYKEKHNKRADFQMTLLINKLPPEAIPADVREELNRKQVKVIEMEDND